MRSILFTVMASGVALAAGSGAAFAATPDKSQAGTLAQAASNTQTPQSHADAAITAQSLHGKTVYDRQKQSLGVVDEVVRDKVRKEWLVVKANNEDQKWLVPAEQVSEDNSRLELTSDQTDLKSFAAFKAGSTDYQEVQGPEKIALKEDDQNGNPAQIVVQQQAPGVRVQEVAPKVEVTQAQPSVEVQQPTPEITVHQPAPTITINIPKPEITVRMPRPNVHVAQAQPQVEVHQQQPKVQVTQPQQQAQISVNDANTQPKVNVDEQSQPKINYDQAQPKVTINQDQGAPKVRFEQSNRASAQDTADQNADASKQAKNADPNRSEARTAQQRQEYMKEFGDEQTASSKSKASGPMKQIEVSQLDKMTVYNAHGDKLGTVVRAIQDKDDKTQYVVIAHGGFLGIGEDRVAFPLQRFALKGSDHLVIHGVTSQDIDGMDNWRKQVSNHQEIAGNQQVEVSTVQ